MQWYAASPSLTLIRRCRMTPRLDKTPEKSSIF